MKKVYVVMWVMDHPYLDDDVREQIEKIFDDEEKANEWASNQMEDEGVTYEVVEWAVE